MKIDNKVWVFVEQYYPNYYSSEEIAKANDIQIKIEEAKSLGSRVNLEIAQIMILAPIYEKAIDGYIASENRYED